MIGLVLVFFLVQQPATVESLFAAQDKALDANPDSEFWRPAPVTSFNTDNYGRAQPGHTSDLRSRWTASNLYFQFTCHYRELYLHPNPVRLAETRALWDWDVAEVFIGSDFSNIRRYREFEMSPQGEWLDLDIDLSRTHPADGWTWNSGMEVVSSINEKKGVWYGAMRIPYASVDSREAAAGNLLRFNFYREQGPPARRIEIAWQPTGEPSYHVPQRFGNLRLLP